MWARVEGSHPPHASPACGMSWVERMRGEQCGGGRARGGIKHFQSFDVSCGEFPPFPSGCGVEVHMA